MTSRKELDHRRAIRAMQQIQDEVYERRRQREEEMRPSLRSPDHGEIDEGGVVTIRVGALDAFIAVAAVARTLFRDGSFLTHLENLKKAVEDLETELGGKK